MNNDLISREALKKTFENACIYGLPMNELYGAILKIIDNAPSVEAFTENDKALAYCEGYVRGSHEAYIKPQGDIRWTDKLSITSSEDIIDFEGRVVGHINLEDIGGAKMRKGGVE